MKRQKISKYLGNDINGWLTTENKRGWFIKEVLEQELSLTGKYQFIFLMENLIEEETDNSKKALAIIRDKKVDVGLFIRIFIEYADKNGGYEDYIEAYNDGPNNASYITTESGEPLDKDEFDLLKEVL